MPNNDKASMAALRRRMVEEGFLKPTIADIIQLVRPETPECVLQLVRRIETKPPMRERFVNTLVS